MKEIWKDIPNYENYYQVSNIGRVKSLSRLVEQFRGNKQIKYKTREIILKQNNNKGYLAVVLQMSGSVKTFKVHRLVMLAFIGESKLQINHIDGNKKNNNILNLEYCTPSENAKHAFKLGLSKNATGSESHLYKYSDAYIDTIKTMLVVNNYKWSFVSRKLGITLNALRDLIYKRDNNFYISSLRRNRLKK